MAERDPDNHPPHSDSTFEIAIRILGNELFALSLTSDSLNKKWLSYSVVIMFLFLVTIAVFGDAIAEFTGDIYGAVAGGDTIVIETPYEN